MKRSLVFALIGAIVMLPFVVSTNADAVTIVQYQYYEYYFDSYGNQEGYSFYVTGASDEDALYLEMHTTYYKRDSAGNWMSLRISSYFYYKDGEYWIYSYGWWLEWHIIEEWLFGDQFV